MTSELVVDLHVSASEILAEHAAATAAMRDGLAHARRCGELLNAAKAQLEHGQWLPWLTENCPDLSVRMAQAYMRVAREWPRLEEAANTQRVSHLRIREALGLLAEPKAPADNPLWRDSDIGEIDWLARSVAMDAAWEDLGAALDDLAARQVTSLEEAWDAVQAAEELEARTVALYMSTIRDLRILNRYVSRELGVPVHGRIRPLTNPDAVEGFFADVRERLGKPRSDNVSGTCPDTSGTPGRTTAPPLGGVVRCPLSADPTGEKQLGEAP